MSLPGRASPEVIDHHYSQHVERCPSALPLLNAKHCPCGHLIWVSCEGCDRVLFLATTPNVEPCVHALMLAELIR